MKKFKEWILLKEFRNTIPKFQPVTRPVADVRDFRQLLGPTGSFIDRSDARDITDLAAQAVSGIFAGIGAAMKKGLDDIGLTPSIPPIVVSFKQLNNNDNMSIYGDIIVPDNLQDVQDVKDPRIVDLVWKMKRNLSAKLQSQIVQHDLDPDPDDMAVLYVGDDGKLYLRSAFVYKPKKGKKKYLPKGYEGEDW